MMSAGLNAARLVAVLGNKEAQGSGNEWSVFQGRIRLALHYDCVALGRQEWTVL